MNKSTPLVREKIIDLIDPATQVEKIIFREDAEIAADAIIAVVVEEINSLPALDLSDYHSFGIHIFGTIGWISKDQLITRLKGEHDETNDS